MYLWEGGYTSRPTIYDQSDMYMNRVSEGSDYAQMHPRVKAETSTVPGPDIDEWLAGRRSNV